MIENIQKIDLNFSNAGGGHTATVSSIIDGKSLSGKEGLGSVVGEAGEINSFSNARINSEMQRFQCTTLTTARDATKAARTRKYVDKTTLRLNSMVVLVRGLNCSPEGGENHLTVPFYSEVSNSPLKSFKAQGALRKDSVIEVGKIYNVEEASNYQGVKAYLVYNNKNLNPDLSMNMDFVSDSYKTSPDLSQFQLKCGYTLRDFKEIMTAAGVNISGLPENSSFEKILFQNSGTLASVVSSIASFLGCFWYVDPAGKGVKFVNTAIASSIPITDYTTTNDKSIINASFTEDYIKNDIVNVYTGSTEKPPQGAGTPAHGDGVRSRNAMFRRVRIESLDEFRETFNKDGKFAKISQVLGTYFALFNQGQGQSVFDMYTYVISMCEARGIFQKEFGDNWKNFTIQPLYPDSPSVLYFFYFSAFVMLGEAKVRLKREVALGRTAEAMYGHIEPAKAGKRPTAANSAGKIKGGNIRGEHRAGRPNKDGFLAKYIDKHFQYLMIMHGKDKKGNPIHKMSKPSDTDLFHMLDNYFKMAKGLWLSNAYSTYKAERMEFTNSNNMTVVGPFHKDSFVHEHDELQWLDDFFQIILGGRPVRIRSLAKNTNPKAKILNDWIFIGYLTAPKVAKLRDERAIRAGKVKKVDFGKFMSNSEIFTMAEAGESGIAAGCTFVGGPSRYWKDMKKNILGMVKQSMNNFSESVEWNKSTSIRYNRSKTRVNHLTEEGEEDEDDQIAESSEGEQKKSDLFDRYDTKYYGVESPPWNLMNKLSLASSSGSTIEMMTLREQRQNYEERTGSEDPQKVFQSTRTIYGLHIPKFEPQMNSITLSVGSNGITTNISESTIKLLPPDQGFLQNLGMESLSPKNLGGFANQLHAGQKNFFGL